jgi:phospholipid/cholesterol/gamma-HCH transport system substrate-binding protein
MSISHAQRARLGIFMVAGGVLLLFFIAIPVGFKLTDKSELYYSFFSKGESISGLVEGAEVRYNGVKIGNVEDILLDPVDFTSVKVVYRIDKSKIIITRGMKAQTGLMGITGLLYVEIS